MNNLDHRLLLLCLTICAGLSAQSAEPDLDLASKKVVPVAPDGGAPVCVYRDDSGEVRADGGVFRATFDGAHMLLLTPPLVEGGVEPQLQLSFLGHHRGRVHVPAQRSVAPEVHQRHVRYQRGGIVETYEAKSNGCEQSFHIAQRPAGSGDLVLTIAVAGNVTSEAVEPRHQALEFRHGEARAIRYGEAIAYDRAGHRVDVMTSYDGLSRIELIVPAAFVASASYPIVVDPAIGPVLNPGGPNYQDFNPDVAYDLETGRYMVVWERRQSATDVRIYGQVYTGGGVPVGGVFNVHTGGINQNPSVVFCRSLTTGTFLVAYDHDGAIRARFITPGGAWLGSPFVVSTPSAGAVDRRPSVAGPGPGAMMIAWDRTPTGESNPKQIVMRDLYWPIPTIPQNVDKGPERVLDNIVDSGWVRNVRLAKSNGRVEVGGQYWFGNRAVWERWWTNPAPGDHDVRTCSFRVRSNPFSFALINSVAAVAGSYADERSPDIASRADLHQDGANMQFCLVWEDAGDVMAGMHSLFAPMGPEFPVRATSNYEGIPAVGAGFCEFTVAYGEIISPAVSAMDIRAARVLLDGTVAMVDKPIDVLGGPPQAGTRVASRPIHTVNEQQTNSTLITWYGATGPVGPNAGDIRARFFEPMAPTVSPFGVACAGPLGELPEIGTSFVGPIPGNDQFRLTIDSAPANSLAVLIVSDVLTTGPIPGAPGCFVYVGLPWLDLLPTVTTSFGDGWVNLPIPCSVPQGAALAFQWAVHAPTANSFGWIVSNDLDVIWSH